MALYITDECINCDICEPECPNEAIFLGEEYYEINPEKCTECLGNFETSQCVDVCPIACIRLDPNYRESKEVLMEKYKKLTGKG